MVDNSMLITGLITVLVLLVTTVVGLSLYTKKQAKTTVLLLGINDAGKTAMYTLLRFGTKRPTVTSMKENEGQITLANKTLELVDLPGHERVRYRYAEYLPATRSIVFVVDGTTLSRQVRPVAEYLYDVLSAVQKDRIPVLVTCNKCDMITALPTEKIKSLLESEINRLRGTRTAAVEQQESEGDEGQVYLGYEGEDFKFEHLDNQVDFERCSVEKEELEDVSQWIGN